MIDKKIRFTVYIIFAIVLVVTYFVKDTENDYQFPILGSIPPFEFVDSDGKVVSKDNLLGKVWVADFIFTTCTMACPVMTGNMNLIHKSFKNNDQVRIVSISVYPEYDTPEIISIDFDILSKKYEKWFNAILGK